ncbi:adenylate kinase [Sesbania bispinosa]|nr:adenylate kinase [Sesbania bispinosa]
MVVMMSVHGAVVDDFREGFAVDIYARNLAIDAAILDHVLDGLPLPLDYNVLLHHEEFHVGAAQHDLLPRHRPFTR